MRRAGELRHEAGQSGTATNALSAGLVEWLIYTLLTALVAAALLAPLALPFLLLALGLTVAINDALLGRLGVPRGLLGPVPVAAYGLCLLVLASAGWSLLPSEAYSTAIVYLLLTLVAVGIPSWFTLLPLADKIKVLRPVAIGGLIGLVLLLADILVSGSLTAALINSEPGLVNPMQKGLSYDHNGVASALGFYFNRNVAALLLVLPGILLAAALCPPFAGRRWLIWAIAAIAAGAILLSSSESAKLGLLAAIAAYGAARLWPRPVRQVLLVVLVLGIALAVPIARLPFAAGLQHAEWLPLSFRDRVAIWDYTGEHVGDAPWLGIGVRGNAIMHARYKRTLAADSQQVLQRRPGWHPHNAYLEIWSELGAAGALLTLLLATGMVCGIDRMPPTVRPAGYALVAAVAAILATGWSLWQAWLIAGVVTAIIIVQLASRTVIDQKAV